MNLNDEQLAVVESAAKKILVLAGPGSGKTATLVARIEHLIEHDVLPQRMVVITFTNAAAAELQKRLGEKVRFGFIGTLHSFIFRLLTKHGALIGLPQQLSIADDDQKEQMIETVIEEMGFKAVAVKKVMPLLKRPDLIEAVAGTKTKEELVAVAYHQTLKAGGLMDFDVMLYYGIKLIRMIEADAGGSLDWWPWTHTFIDEMQDSSDADTAIYEAMPCEWKFMVGDDSQAVYSFRGGNVANILRYSGDKEWTVFKLETNYRCRSKIAEAAQRLIEHNTDRYPKETIADQSGGSVVVEKFSVPGAEMGFIVDELMATTTRWRPTNPREGNNDCAVLCRTNRLVKEFADFLQNLGIPVATKKPVVVPKDWRTAKLLLTVLASPWNDFALHQFLVASVGKPKADGIKLAAAAAMESINGFLDGKFTMTLDSALMADSISMESRQRIRDAAEKLSANGEWTIPDLIMFLNSGEEQMQQIGEGVTVTTFHSAKSREFRTVYLCAVEDNVIPGERKDVDEAEERRLLYVAMTRAEQRLVITYCEARPTNFGRIVMRPASPSRFIKEIGV